MIEHLFQFFDTMHKELLLFASICFLIGSLDDLIFDALWFFHKTKRNFLVYSKHRRATVETLDIVDQGHSDSSLAVFVAAWREATVIGSMLDRCTSQWHENDYRLYVGCYPNDLTTIEAVKTAAATSPNIRLVIVDHPGPTTKADCLNRLWRSMCDDEINESRNFKAVILHDAEDMVHSKALNLFDHLIGRASLVQIPVVPRRASRSRWVAGHYGDEFAELHGKQMVLREALGVSIPSAGVGCAFSRKALGLLSARSQGQPFDATSMTEDYELGMHLTEGASRGIFARLKDQHGQLVATQEFFPDNLEDAIKQKSRWMTGIALSGWDRLGWQNSWCENWMRLRDRKASLAAIVLAMAYIAIVLTGLLELTKLFGFFRPQNLSGELRFILGLNLAFLSWRLAMKSYFVYKIYGLREALLSVPRTIVANIINILAARRALIQYLRNLSGKPQHWDKTRHFLPSEGEIEHLKSSRVSSTE